MNDHPLISREGELLRENLNDLRSQTGTSLSKNSTIKARTVGLDSFNALEFGSELHQQMVNTLTNDNVTAAKRDTVGEYLYGCSIEQHKIDTACTPSCINGFKYDSTSFCRRNVYQYFDCKLTKISSSKDSKEAWVFSDMCRIPSSVRKQLEKDGIANVIVYTAEGDTINYTICKEVDSQSESESTSPSTSSPIGGCYVPHHDNVSTYVHKKKSNDDNLQRNILIGMLIVLVILIILAAVWFTNRRYRV